MLVLRVMMTVVCDILSTLSVCFRFNNLFDSEKILHFYPQQGKGQALALPRALALALPRALALGRASGKGSACYINSRGNITQFLCNNGQECLETCHDSS